MGKYLIIYHVGPLTFNVIKYLYCNNRPNYGGLSLSLHETIEYVSILLFHKQGQTVHKRRRNTEIQPVNTHENCTKLLDFLTFSLQIFISESINQNDYLTL